MNCFTGKRRFAKHFEGTLNLGLMSFALKSFCPGVFLFSSANQLSCYFVKLVALKNFMYFMCI